MRGVVVSSIDDLVKEFLVESYEGLDRLDSEFIALEQDPRNPEHLGSIFRTIHTIKGTCGFFGFERLQAVTHAGESLLSKLRDGELLLNKEMANALLALVDAVRHMLANIESSGAEGDDGHRGLILRLTALLNLAGTASGTLTQLIDDEGLPPVLGGQASQGTLTALFAAADQSPVVEPARSGAAPRASSSPADGGAPADESSTERERLSTARTATTGRTPDQAAGDGRSTGSDSRHHRTDSQRADEHKSESHGLADTTIRVDVLQLDRLMNLVGELVLVRNRILQFSNQQSDKAFIATSQLLNQLTTELQEGVMKTRMQPIGNVWSKFPRVVRDLAQSCGKQVRIEMEGKETELDKTLIEAIKDPLTHIVRNAIDHGIELPAVRQALGKPAEGLLRMHAFHEGGLVIIEIADDGGGINAIKVRAKALEKGLITPQQAAQLDERGMVDLIFLPGFSTAEKVTNISGRGVGMDVVKNNIERIAGHVDIHNRPGLGTTITIKIPLTLAIIPALLVTSGGERFAIPQVSLLELVRLATDQAPEQVYGAPVYRLRGQLLPLVFLNQELGLPPSPPGAKQNLIVLQADDRRFGLVVDAVNDAEEIVVKPLDQALKGLQVYAGATILGDGQVALILDVLGLGLRSHAVDLTAERQLPPAEPKPIHPHQAMLLFTSPDDGRMAIPLNQVTRLEELPRKAIERVGACDIVQLRGEIIPLVYVFKLLPERRKEPRNPDCGLPEDIIQLAIHSHQGRHVGLVVGRILDAVDASGAVQRAAGRPGVLGCLVINERVTEVLDIEGVVRGVLPQFYDQLQPAGG
jgi:two-component system, chemotaxis family, sensor kinase CheA